MEKFVGEVNIQIRKAGLSDCLSVAKMHRVYLDKSFLGTLGERFLNLLYKSLIKWRSGYFVIAENNGRVVGFVAGVANINEFYKYFFKTYFIKASFILLPKVFNLNIILKILETLRHSRGSANISLPEAELLSIAVKKNHQGKGVSKRLFERLVNDFYRVGINEFKIIVGSNLTQAIKFYRKMKCKNVGEIEVHKGERSELYVMGIADICVKG